MGEVVNFSWSLGVSINPEHDIIVTRKKLQDVGRQVTVIVADTIAYEYTLPQPVDDAIRLRLADMRLVLKPNGEALTLDPTSVAISENVSKQEIYFTPSALGEEVINLSIARSAIEWDINEVPERGYDEEVDKRTLLQLSDEHLIGIAAKLVFARRIIKYGLLDNSAMPAEFAPRLFFESWIQKLSENESLRGVEYDADRMRGFYSEENIALKALRRSVWTNLLFRIIGVDDRLYPLFYIAYRNRLGEHSAHTVTFNQPNLPILKPDEVRSALIAIFTPGERMLHSN